MPDIFTTSTPEKGLEPENKETQESQQEPLNKKIGSSSPFAALLLNPRNINFQDQEKDEEVILLLRRHWVTNLPWIFLGSLMLFIPIIVSVIISFLGLQLPFTILLSGLIFWYLLSFGYFFLNFLIWYFNAHLITNKRIVDIDFHSLTYKEVSSTQLERIQDVNFRVGGVIRHVFDYGDVFVQTAGSEPNFDFNGVPKPAFVADKLTDLMALRKVGV